jgi:hypothetical protein
LFESFKKWWRSEPDIADNYHGPHTGQVPGDWVVLPFRVAEACRISLYTIGSHPEMPRHLAWWIAQWMAGYNTSVAKYFELNYGPDIFPVLQKITASVVSDSEKFYEEQFEDSLRESFDRWEQQLGDDGSPG